MRKSSTVVLLGTECPAAPAELEHPFLKAFNRGAELVPGVVRAVEIKGHTPGSSGYLIGAGKHSILFVGDTLHHYVVSVREPSLLTRNSVPWCGTSALSAWRAARP